MAKLVQVIIAEGVRGLGKEGDPIRPIYEFWTPDGMLIARIDPYHPEGGRVVEFNATAAANCLEGGMNQLLPDRDRSAR